ncbi:unnamed protein product [Calicophoron daubneyi]|uniref:inositol-polyphosphate 5-phosphatase n=1 Tax=Calicophoron daubneyi TaxID=300641 RepID=A0AAV2TEG4_CALDB
MLLNVFFLTSNVGGLVRKPSLRSAWCSQIAKAISEHAADFVAVHLQELGEKSTASYPDKSFQTDIFIRLLHDVIKSTDTETWPYIYYAFANTESSSEMFTALGSIYFINRRFTDCKLWNFVESRFQPVSGENVEYLSSCCPFVSQGRFPVELFPSGHPSRKGFMRTRWLVENCVMELVNVHLFNDSNNMESFKNHPSRYARHRADGLRWVLDLCAADGLPSQHLIIFGDFNFRPNLPAYVEKTLLRYNAVLSSASNSINVGVSNAASVESNDIDAFESKINGEPLEDKSIFRITPREFDFAEQHSHLWSQFSELLELDEELTEFSDVLQEVHITFPPSYPFTESDDEAKKYSKTRCPAWCDRILLDRRTFEGLRAPRSRNNAKISAGRITYDLLAKDACVGDHKPVYLSFGLQTPEDQRTTSS